MTERSADAQPPGAHEPRPASLADILTGGLFAAVALAGLYLARDYDMGGAARMGTGYVPRLVCLILLALGSAITLRGLAAARRGLPAEAEPAGVIGWRPLVMVTLAIAAFGVLVERAGLVAAAAALILLGALANRDSRPLETLVVGLFLVAGSVLVFVKGLGLSMPVWPEF